MERRQRWLLFCFIFPSPFRSTSSPINASFSTSLFSLHLAPHSQKSAPLKEMPTSLINSSYSTHFKTRNSHPQCIAFSISISHLHSPHLFLIFDRVHKHLSFSWCYLSPHLISFSRYAIFQSCNGASNAFAKFPPFPLEFEFKDPY